MDIWYIAMWVINKALRQISLIPHFDVSSNSINLKDILKTERHLSSNSEGKFLLWQRRDKAEEENIKKQCLKSLLLLYWDVPLSNTIITLLGLRLLFIYRNRLKKSRRLRVSSRLYSCILNFLRERRICEKGIISLYPDGKFLFTRKINLIHFSIRL